jgi:hypothetical protein
MNLFNPLATELAIWQVQQFLFRLHYTDPPFVLGMASSERSSAQFHSDVRFVWGTYYGMGDFHVIIFFLQNYSWMLVVYLSKKIYIYIGKFGNIFTFCWKKHDFIPKNIFWENFENKYSNCPGRNLHKFPTHQRSTQDFNLTKFLYES